MVCCVGCGAFDDYSREMINVVLRPGPADEPLWLIQLYANVGRGLYRFANAARRHASAAMPARLGMVWGALDPQLVSYLPTLQPGVLRLRPAYLPTHGVDPARCSRPNLAIHATRPLALTLGN